ncbi:MAG: imidazole glycerol phosphate synthase subunit HisF [Alphaproteobacteria bacterium]
MYKRRLIPVLYLKDGWMVRSERFQLHQIIGDPVGHVERMVQWDVDELVVLNIGAADSTFQHDRDDYKNQPVRSLLEFITKIAVDCCIPLTFGGHIVSVEDVALRIANGADKVSMNTALADTPQIVTDAAKRFGSQAVVASIDYRMDGARTRVFVARGNRDVASDVVPWARHAEQLGAGEILLNAIDRDGGARGYDLDTIDAVVDAVAIPVIACGGAGHQRHFRECFQKTGASAVAAGNIFHFTENAYPRAKTFLKQTLADIR